MRGTDAHAEPTAAGSSLRRCGRMRPSLRGPYYAQRTSGNRNLGWRLAYELPVSIDFLRRSRFQQYSLCLRVIDLGREQMLSKIHRRKHAKQLEGIQRVDAADIELAIGEISLRRNAHAVAIELSVGERGEQGGFLRLVVTIAISRGSASVVAIDLCQPHRESWKFEQQREQRQGVATVSAQPARHLIGTPRYRSIQSTSSYGAEIVNTLRRGRFNDDTEIHSTRLNPPRLEIAPGAQRISCRAQS